MVSERHHGLLSGRSDNCNQDLDKKGNRAPPRPLAPRPPQENVSGPRRTWIRACRLAGLPDRLPHDFRRTAVRNLERAGVSRSVAMKLTGHKTESIYRRYAIVAEQDLRDGVAKLAALHQKKPLRPLTAPTHPEVATGP
jgi:integrase